MGKFLVKPNWVLRFNSRGLGAAVAVVISSFIFLSQVYILPSGKVIPPKNDRGDKWNFVP